MTDVKSPPCHPPLVIARRLRRGNLGWGGVRYFGFGACGFVVSMVARTIPLAPFLEGRGQK